MTDKMQVRVPEDMYELFRGTAKRNSQTPSMLVRQWIRDYIAKEYETYGSVDFEGDTYILIEQAYENHDNLDQYKAKALTPDGEYCYILWDLRENASELFERFDGSEICDWDKPVGVEKVEKE